MYLVNFIKYILLITNNKLYYKAILSYNSEILLISNGASYKKKIISLLKKHTLLNYNTIIDSTIIDTNDINNKFILYLNIVNLLFIRSISLYFPVYNNNTVTIVNIWQSSYWLEREMYEMYGVIFEQNDDLRILLLNYNFKGFPLRKDFV